MGSSVVYCVRSWSPCDGAFLEAGPVPDHSEVPAHARASSAAMRRVMAVTGRTSARCRQPRTSSPRSLDHFDHPVASGQSKGSSCRNTSRHPSTRALGRPWGLDDGGAEEILAAGVALVEAMAAGGRQQMRTTAPQFRRSRLPSPPPRALLPIRPWQYQKIREGAPPVFGQRLNVRLL